MFKETGKSLETQYKTSRKEKSIFIPNPYRRKDGQNTWDNYVKNNFEYYD